MYAYAPAVCGVYSQASAASTTSGNNTPSDDMSWTYSLSPVPSGAFHYYVEEQMLEAPSRMVSRTPSPTGRPPRSSATTMSELRMKIEARSRNFSPRPWSRRAAGEAQDEPFTPRGQILPTGGEGSGKGAARPTPALPPGVWGARRPTTTASAATMYGGGHWEGDASLVPPPPAPVAPRSAHGGYQASRQQPHQQAFRTFGPPAPVVTSIGTVGHPFNCGEACKYAKKPRGCKDGAQCTRCHCCDWSKHGARTSVVIG